MTMPVLLLHYQNMIQINIDCMGESSVYHDFFTFFAFILCIEAFFHLVCEVPGEIILSFHIEWAAERSSKLVEVFIS